MHRALGLALIFGLFSGGFGIAYAQNRSQEASGERYSFQMTDQGVLRFDSRTGEVSQCTVGATGAICRAAPDERAAFESEIARLQAENTALKKALADRGLSAPPPVPPAPIPGVADKSPDGSPDKSAQSPETTKGRIRTAIETAWRNLVAMMGRVKGALQ